MQKMVLKGLLIIILFSFFKGIVFVSFQGENFLGVGNTGAALPSRIRALVR